MMDLTAEQLAVVDHDGPRAVVTGGAGTGKTTTLLARYLRLTKRHPASRVLVVCRHRPAAQRFVAAVLPHLRGGFEALPITTVYGLAHDIAARSEGTVRLLSMAEQRVRVRELLARESPADWPELRRFLTRPAFVDEVVAALPEVQVVGRARAEASGGPWRELAGFAHRYLAALEADGQVDAAGLLALARGSAEGHRNRFDHVLVDDAEGLVAPGALLLGTLVSDVEGVTVSGDPEAGDLPEELVARPSLAGHLTRRFRLTPPGNLVRCNHPSIEPEAVAGELVDAHARGVAWSEMAVLVRVLGHRARAIARALSRHGIPVVPVPALAGDEPVVSAVLDLLRWVDHDESALERLLVSPLARLTPADVRTVRRGASEGTAPESQPLLAPLVNLRDHLRKRLAAGDSPADLAYEAWAAGFSGLADGRGGGLGAVDDRALDALVALVDGLVHHAEREPVPSLARTLAMVEEGGLTPDPWRAAASTGADGVTITAIRGAAGQEWHTVIVAGCVEGELPRPQTRARLFDADRLHRAPAAADALRQQELVDERRLFALATSRATGRLTATAAPEPGVLLSRFVEDWTVTAARLPLAPGQPPADRAATAGAVPVWPEGRLRLSASQLATYDDCPLRYAYQYGLRAKDESGVHAGLGALVHEVLATFLNPDDPQPHTRERLLAVADSVWRDDIARYRPQVEEARRDFLAMLNAWWEHEGSQEELGPEVLAVERRFEFDVGPHRLSGFIDRIDRADDGVGIRVVDYKTGKKEPSAGDVAEDLQLAVYHLAAGRDPELAALGPATQLQLRYLRSMRTYDQPLSDDHAAATETRILATADRILAEEFAPAVDATCRNCSFQRLCPLWPEGRQVDRS